MHPAVKPDVRGILTNQAKPTRQTGALGATKFEPLSNLLDSESVYHISMLHKHARSPYSTSAQAEGASVMALVTPRKM
jgi:hypothetical protein